MKLTILLSLLAVLFLPAAALAIADGDPCDPAQVDLPPVGVDFTVAPISRVFCYTLAAAKTTNFGPIFFNLWNVGVGSGTKIVLPKGTFPSDIRFKLVLNGCSAGTITITHAEVFGGLESKFNGSPTIGLAAGGTSAFQPLPGERYGNWLVTNGTGMTCSGDVTLVVEGFVERRGPWR